jgi:hypothetical protein
MNDVIRIRELSPDEVARLIKDEKFNTLRPTFCSDCGQRTEFARRIFQIQRNAREDDENLQGIISHHIKQRYGCEHVFFKVWKSDYYADTAVCNNCRSSKIVFDIELNENILEVISKLTNTPGAKIKQDIERISSKLNASRTKKRNH